MTHLPGDQHITYQLQFRKCGKPSCSTCRDGQGHGPYWYAYWREGSRLHSGYVGIYGRRHAKERAEKIKQYVEQIMKQEAP